MSLVLELQAEALRPEVRVADLLRKALVVARKLRVDKMRSWIEQELNGYVDQTLIPSYREVHGELKTFNPYRGLIPIIFETEKQTRKLTRRLCGQPIAELENLAIKVGDKDGQLMMPLPAELAQSLLGDDSRLLGPPALYISNACIAAILDAIRNAILDWALRLEEDGILGEGISFSRVEEERAQQAAYNVAIYGDATHAQIQIGSSSSSQDSRTASVGAFVVNETTTVQQTATVQVSPAALSQEFIDLVVSILEHAKAGTEIGVAAVQKIEKLSDQIGDLMVRDEKARAEILTMVEDMWRP